jgi:uncharacterized OB-fold protein
MGITGDDERTDPAEVTVGMYRGLDLVVAENDSERRGYYEEAKQGRLVVQRCDECRMLRGIIAAACPYCTSLDWTWQPVAGTGAIYSWQIVTHATHPAFKDWVPYPIVLVELDEQRDVPWRDGAEGETTSLRIIANLCGPDPTRPESEENVGIGLRVEVCFIDLDDTMALPQFRLSAHDTATQPG